MNGVLPQHGQSGKQPAPCKLFNKKHAIACYKLRWNHAIQHFDHYEMLRITNETPGEYYVFPIETLQKSANRHFSYHKSGAFHWRESDGKRIVPVAGESDQRRADLLTQAMAHLFHKLDGYCVAIGRDVDPLSLAVMLSILDGYIIPPIAAFNVFEQLLSAKSACVPLTPSRYQELAGRIIDEEEKAGNVKKLSADELAAKMHAEFPNAKFVQLNPKPTSYATYSDAGTTKIINIARGMIADKLIDRSAGFWTGK
jgi:hypothetical protein